MAGLIFLYGAPASGKSTLGRRLASALGVGFADLDEEVVRHAGRPIPDIFATEGERAFRACESEVLAKVCASFAAAAEGPCAAVVALGGGTLLDDANRALAERVGTVWCIDTPSREELAKRLAAAPGSRPLGDRSSEREAHYASFAHRVARWFELESSLVVVGSGLASAVLAGRKIVVDETVAALHRGILPPPVVTLPSGERHKVLATVEKLWDGFGKAGLGRRDTVVAVGGGVTGDLTGFAAATFMRGIGWINVPTTLLAMVDASTGGKTGFDRPDGKNLVGAFHSPGLVVIDVDFLKTLPSSVLNEGKAEMIKHEIIGGRMDGGLASLTAAQLARNLSVKVGIVREDPFERSGRRLLLNCGHTVAHAVEKLSGYAVSHGAAVAIGCVAEARIAVRRGLASAGWPTELAAAFAAEGLPTELPEGMSRKDIVQAMKEDKKRSGGVVTFALPCGWGDVRAVPIDLTEECA